MLGTKSIVEGSLLLPGEARMLPIICSGSYDLNQILPGGRRKKHISRKEGNLLEKKIGRHGVYCVCVCVCVCVREREREKRKNDLQSWIYGATSPRQEIDPCCPKSRGVPDTSTPASLSLSVPLNREARGSP